MGLSFTAFGCRSKNDDSMMRIRIGNALFVSGKDPPLLWPPTDGCFLDDWPRLMRELMKNVLLFRRRNKRNKLHIYSFSSFRLNGILQ